MAHTTTCLSVVAPAGEGRGTTRWLDLSKQGKAQTPGLVHKELHIPILSTDLTGTLRTDPTGEVTTEAMTRESEGLVGNEPSNESIRAFSKDQHVGLDRISRERTMFPRVAV